MDERALLQVYFQGIAIKKRSAASSVEESAKLSKIVGELRETLGQVMGYPT
jgi:hypothetical protein